MNFKYTVIIIVVVSATIAFFAYQNKKKSISLLNQLQQEISLDVVINSRPIIALNNAHETLFVIGYDNVLRFKFADIKQLTLITPRKNGNNAGGTVGTGSGIISFINQDNMSKTSELSFGDINEDVRKIRDELNNTNLAKKIVIREN